MKDFKDLKIEKEINPNLLLPNLYLLKSKEKALLNFQALLFYVN